jgi:3-methyl-2-oxobutanoate hydroxymethyltransferase
MLRGDAPGVKIILCQKPAAQARRLVHSQTVDAPDYSFRFGFQNSFHGAGESPMSAPSLSEKLAAFRALKPAGRKVVMLTAADYPVARLLDEAGVDLILVGDSMGMVTLGYPDTVEVTLDDMCHHTRAVRRGVARTLVGGDLPWHTYQTPQQALVSALALVEAGADAVKLEGGTAMLPQVQAIITAGIPFIGHIGMLPQSVREEGGYKKKGRTAEEAARLVDDARALDAAGALAIVVEGTIPAVAREITADVQCPTVGIGSGADCDGQILVTADLVGAFPWFRPPFARARADVAGEILRATREFAAEVRGPGPAV